MKKLIFALVALLLAPTLALGQANFSNSAGIRAYDSSIDANKVTVVGSAGGASAQQVQGTAATGSPPVGNPLLQAVFDGTNIRPWLGDSAGRGAITINGGTLPAGTNNIGGVSLFPPANATANALVPTASAAVSAGVVVKASAGNLFAWRVTAGASAGYVLVLNSATIPADGAVTPLDCVPVAANASVGTEHMYPDRHATGIVIVFSTTGCYTKTSSATAFIRAKFN
jgi:hypothetical protein